MITHRHLDKRILAVISLVALAVIGMMVWGQSTGAAQLNRPVYETKLFDDSRVQTIDIQMADWPDFLSRAKDEEYSRVKLVINGETVTDVGLRVKGNNSLRLTQKYGHDRFSLKIKFDEYVTGQTFHGLDKFSLDSSFQDNSYLKSYLAYDMMRYLGVASPLTSYVWVTVNGEDWGLFLAIEEPEEAFAKRNYGPSHGILYKPDYKNLKHENADVHLRYTDDDFESYDNIFRKAKFNVTPKDKRRLIESLRILSTKENLDQAVDIEAVLRYFVGQVFVVNLDSYLGPTGHNYFLYEKDGLISMLPWDYNLAFGTYSLGMPNPINDAKLYVNFPIDTPAAGEHMLKRPLYHHLMLQKDYHERYHQLFDEFIKGYFETGHFEVFVEKTTRLIDPYVERDPTAFISYEDYLIGVNTITEFSLLRAQSIRGQLDGWIPATIKGQRLDPSNLIEVDDLWLPDMGEVKDLKTKPSR